MTMRDVEKDRDLTGENTMILTRCRSMKLVTNLETAATKIT
jgi:hypothetical protein